MNFNDYIKPELLVLIPVLSILGAGLKASGLSEKWLPLVIGAAGIIFAGLYIISSCECTGWQTWVMAAFASITQGILVAGASVYANQILVQARRSTFRY